MTHACSSSACEHPLGDIEEEEDSFFEEKFWYFIIPSVILIGIAIFIEFTYGEVIFSQIFALTSIIFSSPGVLREAIEDIRRKRITANILMVIAAVASFFILHGQEGATAILLYSIAEKLEDITADKSRNAIKDLLELAPDEALLKTEQGYQTVLSKDVRVGNIVGIKPGMKVPLDGKIINGSSYFNESAITGESIPVYKKEGDEIFAASLNSDSFVDMTVLKESSNTLVAQIVDSVKTAQLNRSKQEKFIEKFAKYYTPVILALSLTVMIVPQFFFHDFYNWFYRGLVLLVVSCPCALTLSTPLANIASLTKLAREGILVKGNRFIEKVKEIEVFAFDKTGTLTEGKLKIFDVIPYNGLEKSELLKIAGSLESLSEHPIGKAITNQTKTLDLSFYPVNNFEIVKGKGIMGEIDGKTYQIGSQAYFEELKIDIPKKALEDVEQLGTIPVLLANGTQFLGFITIRDVLRVTAPIIIEGLKKRGFKTVLISGDNQLVCNTIGSCLDIDESLGERLPNQKLDEIKELKKKYNGVAMVGDGINDAPALALSDLGIAIGASATDITVETADVILINDDLKKILTFLDIAKKTNKKIKQNIWTSISIKLTFAFLTVIGLMTLWLAVGIGDMGVSLLVLANGMTIFRYKFLYKQIPIEEIESQATSLICSHCKTKDIIPQHHGRDMVLKDDKLVCWKNILKSKELETCDEEILLNCPYCKNQLELK